MARKIRSEGFAILIALIILAILLIGLGGWYGLHNKDHKTTKTNNTPQQTTDLGKRSLTLDKVIISTEDRKISIALPNTWHVIPDSNNSSGSQVISVNKDTQICKGGVCGVAGCIDTEDPVPCVYKAEFLPKDLAQASDRAWILTIEKSSWTTSVARQSLLGNLSAQNTIEQSSESINGYNALYIKTKSSGSSVGDYVDLNYFIEKNGYLIRFSNREQYTNNSSNPVHWDNSKYSTDFSSIVRSIELNV